ncbi:MAG: aminopeptidase P family protein [Phycisphaeraceae bacterium]|nr:aminopeptidase P family protein [Phycisphaeraceae bacterium]
MRKKQTSTMPDHLKARLKTFQKRLALLNVDALLINNPVDIRYLSGFVGDDSWLLVRSSSQIVHILSDFRFKEQIQIQAPHAKVIMRKTSLTVALKNLCSKLNIQKVGLQQDHLTLSQHRAIGKELGKTHIKAVDDGLVKQRAVKDSPQLAPIRKALKIQQEAFNRTCAFIEPGMTESQIAAYLEYQMRRLGADGSSFPSIVAADANASLPHAIPGSKKVRKGGIILIDWGAKFKGYCSDLTRVVAIGKMPTKIKEIYSICLEAQMAAIDAIAPGKLLSDIDAVARNIISKAGYGKEFGHSLGHGIGLDIHEQPVLASRAQGVLEPGHIVTVEPGIYLPRIGGVRIEDDVLVTKMGKKVLSDLPKTLESTII